MTVASAAPTGGRANLAFANLAHFYSHLFLLIYPTAVLALEREMGGTYGELLALSLPGFILFGAAALPAGWLGDRWSATGMMALFFIGTGAASIVTGLATGTLGLAVGMGLIGLFASIYHPVGTAIVVASAVNRGRALGLNGVFGSAGFAVAPILAGALIWIAGWRAAFIVPGIVCLATGLAYLAAARAALHAAKTGAPPVSPAPQGHFVRRDAIRGLGILAITSLSIGLISQSLVVGLPKVFDVRVESFAWAGVVGTSGLVTLALIFSMAGQLFGGRLADRFPLKWVFLSTYALMAPMALLAAGLSDLPLVGVCAVVMMLTSAGLPAENSLVARYCPDRWHATAYGTKFVLALGVSSLAVPMVGIIYDTTGGFYWLFIAVAAFAATIATAASLLPRGGHSPVAALAE